MKYQRFIDGFWILGILIIACLFTLVAVLSTKEPLKQAEQPPFTETAPSFSASVPDMTETPSLDVPTQDATEATSPNNTEPPATQPVPPQFTTAPEDYFSDALFIGDSRAVGLNEYGGIQDADFFASVGMTAFQLFSDTVSIPNMGRITLPQLLNAKQYAKIYIMTGINELGYSMDRIVEQYGSVLDAIQSAQPNAIIYICANLHVTKTFSDGDPIYNNQNIDVLNHKLSAFADSQQCFYLDINERFDDHSGNLDKKYTYDNSHLLGKYYKDWTTWLTAHAIVR